VKTVSLSPGPYHLATIKGTGKIYVSSSDEPKVWVIDQANLHVIGEIAIGGKGHQMAIAPGL
jgi:YVTN family beta-propeller protein